MQKFDVRSQVTQELLEIVVSDLTYPPFVFSEYDSNTNDDNSNSNNNDNNNGNNDNKQIVRILIMII